MFIDRSHDPSLLAAICWKLGIHPNYLLDAQLWTEIIHCAAAQEVQITNGKVNFLTPNQGLYTHNFQSQLACPTCGKFLNPAQPEKVGISRCCRRLYCQYCQQEGWIGFCPRSAKPVCRQCGLLVLIPPRGKLLFHRDCAREAEALRQSVYAALSAHPASWFRLAQNSFSGESR
ncbi:MAG: hypothetical protein AB1656_24600 [Candidatus Omnitrophota bacterium]